MKAACLAAAFLCLCLNLMAQSFMMNPYGCRNATLLNGKWNAIIDPFSRGEPMKFYENRKPKTKTEFVEYAFGNGLRIDVPGDFNSQTPELKYYEGNVWYQRHFTARKNPESTQYEEYQEELYRKNYLMFENIPNLRGTCPWVLFDFRSPTRCHPQHQDGWNRKGLVSDKGQRKKAWSVVKRFYDKN